MKIFILSSRLSIFFRNILKFYRTNQLNARCRTTVLNGEINAKESMADSSEIVQDTEIITTCEGGGGGEEEEEEKNLLNNETERHMLTISNGEINVKEFR